MTFLSLSFRDFFSNMGKILANVFLKFAKIKFILFLYYMYYNYKIFLGVLNG